MPGRHAPVSERFWRFVVKDEDGCWRWSGSRNPKGYGRLNVGKGVVVFAHRVSWELHAGRTFPSGMTIDHLCRNTSCVNPAHLEVVTAIENFRRGLGDTRTRPCGRGHDPARKVFRANGRMVYCRDCRNANRKAAYWSERGRAPAL